LADNRLVILGAGPMGLAAGFEAVKRGFDVDILEAGDRPGGMAAHFDFDGLSIERFYHFCCLSDADTLRVLAELGLSDKMRWASTRMGLYYQGRLYPWGDPLSLLAFPKLGPIGKLRYGLQAFHSVQRTDWSRLDRLNAEQWFVGWLGRKLYDQLWRPLIHYKFHDMAEHVSAAWMWQRMQRLGRSRKSLFSERLGYIEGGSETLMNALSEAIIMRGGRIHLSMPAARIEEANGQVTGVRTAAGRLFEAPRVISTVPLPVVPGLLTEHRGDLKAAYARIRNIGVVCVIHKLKRPVTDRFWTNIIDDRFDLPGVIEFSNLRPLDETVVYAPYYLPADHPKFQADDESFIAESFACLQALNPALTPEDRLASHVGRLRHAQPIYEPSFQSILPPVQTPIAGLMVADTAYYYPEDRGVSESFRFAKRMVDQLPGTGT
jgi:protoporphyrinogen oxidase